MTRSTAAYALLTTMGAGLVAQTGDGLAQSANNLTIIDKLNITLCSGEVAKQLQTDVQVIAKGGNLVIAIPAPAPNTGKLDACIIQGDGSLTNIYGKPDPERPACKAAEALQKCRADAQPKAGS